MNRNHLTLIHFKVTHVSAKNLELLTANKMKLGFDARSQNMRLIKCIRQICINGGVLLDLINDKSKNETKIHPGN